MMKWERAARSLLCVMALVASVGSLVGCATQHTAIVPGKDEVRADQGVVLLSVTSNSPRSGQFDSIVLELETPKGHMSETYVLNQVSKGMARDTALFIGAVPAGRYKVARFNVGQLFIALSDVTRERIGVLEVKAGVTQDLGRLVVTNLNNRVLVGRSELVKSNVDLVKRFAPDSSKYAQRIDGAGWIAPRDAKDKTEEFALATPAGATSLTELSSGEVVAVSRVGSILVRSQMGKWRRLGINGLESLLWLKPVDQPDAKLVAVGEFNTIAQVGADWKVRRLDPGNLPAGNLLFVDGNAHDGWFVAQQSAKTVTIYRADRIDAGDWKPVKSVDVSFSAWNGPTEFWAWPTSQGFAYAVSSGQVNWYNIKTGTWSQSQAPNERRISGVQPGTDDSLGLMTSPGGGFGGLFAQIHMSTDKGASWQTLTSPFKVNARAPVRLPSGVLLLQGSALSNKEIYRSNGVDQPWTKLDTEVYISEQLVALPTKGVFAIDDGSSPSGYASIRQSPDDGRTWLLEYSNYVELNK